MILLGRMHTPLRLVLWGEVGLFGERGETGSVTLR